MKQLLFLLSIILSLQVSAQISRGGHPMPYDAKAGEAVIRKLPLLDRSLAIRRNFENEEQLNGKKPFHFAESVNVSCTPSNSGSWFDSGNGIKIWRLAFTSENAYALSVFFTQFRLEGDAMVFLYDEQQDYILGGFNRLNNKPSGNLQADFVPGSKIIVELHSRDTAAYGRLEIGRVSRAYIDIFSRKDGRHGLAGDCNIGINCPEGNDWQVIKQAVCRIYIGSRNEFCTGTLINNVNSDGTPYLLTANHCIKYPSDAQSSVFVFGYESPDCSDTDGSVSLSLSSAQVVATSDSLDFTLVKLTDMPPESYKPYYAGWNISDIPSTASVSIHHPWGDVKMISLDDDRLLTTYQSVNPPPWLSEGSAPEAFWRVGRWDAGTTEPGSSGAPLFNPAKQIVGNLTGGDATCAIPENDYFSKFFKCWNYFPEKNRSLHSWLDPDGSNVESINGYDPYNPDEPIQFLERFLVYPNPGDGHFSLEIDTLSLNGAQVRIYDTIGRLLGNMTVSSSKEAVFDFSSLNSGVYILEIKIGELRAIRKIIIAK